MTPRQFADILRSEFIKRINRKTGWGKEELKHEYAEAEREALLYLTDTVKLDDDPLGLDDDVPF